MSDTNEDKLFKFDPRTQDVKPVTSIYNFFDRHEEYPEGVAERGVPEDTLYAYISSTFLNGYINYVKCFYAVMIERYCDWGKDAKLSGGEIDIDDGEKPIDIEAVIATLKDDVHTDLSRCPDDVLVLGETDTCYWFFWFDHDVSDCQIGRFKKDDIRQDEVKASLVEFLKNARPVIVRGNYIELPPFKGWVSF